MPKAAVKVAHATTVESLYDDYDRAIARARAPEITDETCARHCFESIRILEVMARKRTIRPAAIGLKLVAASREAYPGQSDAADRLQLSAIRDLKRLAGHAVRLPEPTLR